MSDTPVPALNECAIAFDLDGQKVVFTSSTSVNVLGYPAACFSADPGLLFGMIDPAYRDVVLEKVHSLREGEQLELNYPVQTRTGEKRWVHDRKTLAVGNGAAEKILLSLFSKFNHESVDEEDEARVSEQLLHSLVDSQTNFLIRFDTNGYLTFANKQFLKTLGYKKSELIGKHFSVITIPEETEKCQKAFIYCLKHPGKVISLSHKKRDKAGNLIDTEWEFISVVSADGIVKAVQGIGHDVTHKLIYEKQVKAAAEKLDTFIESINDYFFILDNEWRFTRVNTAFEKVTRKNREELLGFPIWEVFPIIVGTGFEYTYRKAAANQEVIHFTEHVLPANMWFNTTAYPSAAGLTVFMQDITEEKRAQEDGIWTKNNLEALINNTEDQIWSVDKDTRYVYMNKAYSRQIFHLTGLEPKKGDYPYLNAGFTAEEIGQWNTNYQRALGGERYTIISESVDPENGKVLSFEISFNPIYKVKGDITGVGCFARNITTWLETEKAIVDQNERLRHIASLTSHELRRPVASMLGLINIMDRQNFFNPDNKEIIEHLLTVGNEIDQVIRLIVDKTFTGDRTREKYNVK